MNLSVVVVVGFIVILAGLLFVAFKVHDDLQAIVKRQKGDFKVSWQKKKKR